MVVGAATTLGSGRIVREHRISGIGTRGLVVGAAVLVCGAVEVAGWYFLWGDKRD